MHKKFSDRKLKDKVNVADKYSISELAIEGKKDLTN
jgi:hypothetical protein